MTISLTYYALTLNAGSLAGDLFLNTFFLSLTEAVGYTAILFTLSTPLGRAGSLSLFMLLSGAFVLATAPLAVGTLFHSLLCWCQTISYTNVVRFPTFSSHVIRRLFKHIGLIERRTPGWIRKIRILPGLVYPAK